MLELNTGTLTRGCQVLSRSINLMAILNNCHERVNRNLDLAGCCGLVDYQGVNCWNYRWKILVKVLIRAILAAYFVSQKDRLYK
jgi:hypothetical protein